MRKAMVAVVGVTLLWLVFGVFVVVVKWGEIKCMPLNNFGDFLAGYFSPLAFFWLVFGYFQQGKELSLNTLALNLQVKELNESVKQQRELVEVSKVEAEISRESLRHAKEIEERNAQPKLSFKIGSYNGGFDRPVLAHLEIWNKGHSVTNVRLESDDVKLSPDSFWVLDEGGRKDVEVNIPFKCVSSFSFKVRYVDGLGHEKSVVVNGFRCDNGSFDFVG